MGKSPNTATPLLTLKPSARTPQLNRNTRYCRNWAVVESKYIALECNVAFESVMIDSTCQKKKKN
jgi:hypothetical protein